MLCVKCGREIASDALLCNHCGTVVGAAPQRGFSTFSKPTFTPPKAPGGASAAFGATPAAAGPRAGGRVPTLVARVKGIVLHPDDEWPIIASEPSSAREIYFGYVLPLAAIGVIATFVASALIGVQTGPVTVRASIPASLVAAVVHLALMLAGVFLLSRFVDRVVPKFDGQKDRLNSLRLVAYSLTPAWVAAILLIVPALGDLVVLAALYGAYLLYLGFQALLRCKPMNAVTCTVLTVAFALAVNFLFVMAAGFLIGMIGAGAASPAPGAGNASRVAGATVALVGKTLIDSTAADRARATEAVISLPGRVIDAARGKDTEGSALDMAVATLAVVASGGKDVEPVNFLTLAKLLPLAVGDVPLVRFDGGPETDFGLRGSIVRGRYESGSTKITLEIGDMGEFAGIARVLSRFDPALEHSDEQGYKRSYQLDGNYVREDYDRSDRVGTVAMMVAGRFTIGVRGSGVEPAQLLEAVRAVDAVKLAGLAK